MIKFASGDRIGINFKINISQLIKTVYISPYASPLLNPIIENILKKYQLDVLKIDKSFVSDMDINHQHYLIVESTIALAQKMHVKVVAEGVETMAQADFLRQLGCPKFQGYLFAKPMPAADIPAFLQTEL